MCDVCVGGEGERGRAGVQAIGGQNGQVWDGSLTASDDECRNRIHTFPVLERCLLEEV